MLLIDSFLMSAATADRVRPGSAVASPDLVFDAAHGGWVPSKRETEFEWAAADQGTNPAASPVSNLNLRVKPTPQELLAKARASPKLAAALRDLQAHGTAVISRYYFSDDRESMQFIQDLLDAGFQPPDARPSAGGNAFSRPMSHYMPRAQVADHSGRDPRSIIAQRPDGSMSAGTQPATPPSGQRDPGQHNAAAGGGVAVRGGWPVHDSYNTKPRSPAYGGPPPRTRPF